MMDDGNGLQFLWAVRTDLVPHVRPDVCFLMLTASNDPNAFALAARLDVSGYVTKPVTPDKLRTAIVRGYNQVIRPDAARYNRVLLPQN